MKHYNILIFPCGTEIANEIFRSLKNHKYFKLQGATSIENSYCDFRNIEISQLPFVNDKSFLDELKKIIRNKNIDLIIPAHDDVAYKLSELENKINANVIGQNYNINKIVRFKDKTYSYFEKILPVPSYKEDPENTNNYPLFVKPKKGQGSNNSFKLDNIDDYNSFKKSYNYEDFVIMEYLNGDEFTIDCFSINGKLKYMGARSRDKTINGISVRSSFINDEKLNQEFKNYAETISEELNMDGVWFYQMKYDINGDLRLLEIGPRVSGTMMLNRARGINFVELSIYNELGYELELTYNNFNDIIVGRSLQPVYKQDLVYNNLYIDFDDTLFLDEKYINTELIKLIFQIKNENKNVYLITKHDKKMLTKVLHDFGITNIFDDIIHLSNEENKIDFMKDKSILIDDSFQERNEAIKANFYALSIDNISILLRE